MTKLCKWFGESIAGVEQEKDTESLFNNFRESHTL